MSPTFWCFRCCPSWRSAGSFCASTTRRRTWRARIHQAFSASLWGGILLVLVNLLILALGGHEAIGTWTLVILYFTTVHATFVLIGIVGLAKALAGRCWRIPITGPRLPRGCAP
jgi:hypothetical protein